MVATESTVEARIKGELRKMNGYNSQMSGQANAPPVRHPAQPVGNGWSATWLPALQKSPVAAAPAPAHQKHQVLPQHSSYGSRGFRKSRRAERSSPNR